MKKLLFAAVLSLGSLTAFAQDAEATDQVAATEAVAQEEYTAIETSEVPQAVTDALAKNYPTATLDKAFKNEEEHYKLEVSLEDGTSGTLFADKEGNWIEE